MPHETHNLVGYLDGALNADVRQRVEGHLASCPSCRAEMAGLRQVHEALKQTGQALPRPDYDPQLWGNVHARLEPHTTRGFGRRWVMASGGFAAVAAAGLAMFWWGSQPPPVTGGQTDGTHYVQVEPPKDNKTPIAKARPERGAGTTSAATPDQRPLSAKSSRATSGNSPTRRVMSPQANRPEDGQEPPTATRERLAASQPPQATPNSPRLMAKLDAPDTGLAGAAEARTALRDSAAYAPDQTPREAGAAGLVLEVSPPPPPPPSPSAPTGGPIGAYGLGGVELGVVGDLDTSNGAPRANTPAPASPQVRGGRIRQRELSKTETSARETSSAPELKVKLVPESTIAAKRFLEQAEMANNFGLPSSAVSNSTAALGAGVSKEDQRLAYFYRGDAYLQQNRIPLALEDFRNAVAIKPDLPALLRLGAAEERAGNKAAAITVFQDALKLENGNAEAKAAVERLKTGSQ